MAQALKEQGNAKYQAKQYEEAIKLYSEAIELDSKNAALYRQVTQQASDCRGPVTQCCVWSAWDLPTVGGCKSRIRAALLSSFCRSV